MSDYPLFPPGFWRRIRLYPGPYSSTGAGWIGGALEDDMHHFRLRLDHDGTRITRAAGAALRHPWSGCSGAPAHLAQRFIGRTLAEVAAEDPTQHCTHLFDLAILCAAHVNDRRPSCFDMTVADRVTGRTTAIIVVDGEEALHLPLEGTIVGGDGIMAGRDLRQLSRWKDDYSAREVELVTLLRRAIFVSGVRGFKMPEDTLHAINSPGRMGVCFNYQLPQAETSTRSPDWHTDFSLSGRVPLEVLDPAHWECMA